jgi:hypothetical protein
MQRGNPGFAIVVALTFVGSFALALVGARVREPAPGQQTAMPEALRDHVRTEQFTPVATVAALPAGVRDALRALFGGKTLEMADPGQPFQATDVMVTPRLPARRLVAGGCSTDHCLVYYERGGFAHVHQIALFSTTDTSARLVHGGVAAGGLADLDQVKDALVAGRVMSGSKYW